MNEEKDSNKNYVKKEWVEPKMEKLELNAAFAGVGTDFGSYAS